MLLFSPGYKYKSIQKLQTIYLFIYEIAAYCSASQKWLYRHF